MKTKRTKMDIFHSILWASLGIACFIGAACGNPFHFGTACFCFWVATWRIDNIKKEDAE